MAGGPVDGAVDTPAAGQRLVGGVDHGVDLLGCDVAPYGLDIHDSHPPPEDFRAIPCGFPLRAAAKA
jgi:hypothetical protein